MDMFVMPSRNDSFGMVFLESWLCKKPVIGAYTGGGAEVVSDREDGYLVTFGNIYMLNEYIWKLIRDKELRDAMGKSGYKKVCALHTWDKKDDILRKLYQDLVEK